MAGVDILLDLLKKNQDFIISGRKFDSDKVAASLAIATYLASRALSGLKVRSKQYTIKLQPIYSALKWDALGLTSLKSLQNFLPLLNSRSPMKDLVVALWEAGKYIVLQVVCGTTTRVLEKLAVLCFSPRIASKLVKDVAASVTRKAVNGVWSFKFIFKAAKTTFLGYVIGALASWLLQVGHNIYGFFVYDKSEPVGTWERVLNLGKKIFCTTVTCTISFVFACGFAAIGGLIFSSIGACFGPAMPFFTTAGLFIGFAAGDFVGNALSSFCFGKLGL